MVEIITHSIQLSNIVATILNSCSNIIQDWLPRSCVLCGAETKKTPLCAPCHTQLPYQPAQCCPICALPVTQNDICGQCLKHPPTFDHTLAAFVYAFPVNSLIHALKYGGNLALAGILADPLIALAENTTKPDLLVPMPLHRNRLRERGFNQSMEIARIISRKLDIPILDAGCERILDTLPQASLNLKQRADNIRGAFACSKNLEGLKVVIVDDVMTSGATINELSKTLRAQGAKEVSAWIVARAL